MSLLVTQYEIGIAEDPEDFFKRSGENDGGDNSVSVNVKEYYFN